MLYPKPSAIDRIGLVQFLLALSFVIWLVFFPKSGDNFAWPVACGVFAATMYVAEDWAEIKNGVETLLVYVASLFLLWLFTFTTFDPARKNMFMFGIAPAILIVLLGYFYWRQKSVQPKQSAMLSNA